MRIFNKLRAYSLSEIMTVLLVLTVILAGFAPLITKRRIAAKNTEAPWDFLDRHATYSAATNPNSNSDRNQMFFGVTPQAGSDVESRFNPSAKLVIRSGSVTGDKIQRQIQFRYGLEAPSNRTTDRGSFAGTWLVDRNNNLLGGSYNNINLNAGGNIKNTAIGYNALSNITNAGTTSANGNTAIGHKALNAVRTTRNNTAIGYNAGASTTKDQNVYVGYSAGESNTGSKNVMVGYNSGKGSGSGNNNTYIGAFAGEGSNSAYNNVAVGFNALKKVSSGHDNVALGYGALSKLDTGSNNVAIGYNACSELTKGSNKTCIGANSGPKPNTLGVGNFIKGWEDDVERTYIGGAPHNYGGNAVLEIHNAAQPSSSSKNGIKQWINDGNTKAPAANTTTIINGNLIVRGRTFFTSGSNLYYMHELTGAGQGRVFGATNTDKCATKIDNYNFSCSSNNIFSTFTSDRRLKNVGTKNNAGLDKLSKLKVYNYTFKNDVKKEPHVGVMAQDLQKVFPNSVFEDKSGFLKIRWDEMFFATVNAVKELDQKIVTLVKRTLKLETEIAKLERENTLLKTQVDKLSIKVNKLKAQ